MREVGGIPIIRWIKSTKDLPQCQRRRIKRLKKIFREERRMPLETTLWERKYLYRLEAGRKAYRRRKQRMEAAFGRWRAERRGEIKPCPSMDEIFKLMEKSDSPPTPIDVLLGGGKTAAQNEMKGDDHGKKESDVR